MKKFSFRLQTYLKYCHHLEEVEEIKLNDLLRQEQEINQTIHELSSRRLQAEREWRAREVIPAEEVMLYKRYVAGLHHQLRQLAARRQGLAQKIQQQRLALIQATQKRKVIDRLKDRNLQQHRQLADRTLQQEADDLYLLRRHQSE